MLIEPRIILDTLQATIMSMELPESFTPPGGPAQAAFQQVKIYDMEDLTKAFEELLIMDNRVAIILLEDANHETDIQGRVLTATRTVNITILLADRNWANRQRALMGDNNTPGALFLAHLLIEALAGEQSNGIIVEPGFGELFALQGPSRDNKTGRIAWRQELRIPAGVLRRKLSRHAN